MTKREFYEINLPKIVLAADATLNAAIILGKIQKSVDEDKIIDSACDYVEKMWQKIQERFEQ